MYKEKNKKEKRKSESRKKENFSQLLNQEILSFKNFNEFNPTQNIFEVNLMEKYIIREIKGEDTLLLRKITDTEDLIDDKETEIIEVLSLNFPESEEYKFPIEYWINLWIKYGGWIDLNNLPQKNELSIKEAREFFSKIPSKTEVIFDYYFSTEETLYNFCKYKSQHYLSRYISFLNIHLENFNYDIVGINLDYERFLALKRYKLFGRPIPLEILSLEEMNYLLRNERLKEEYLSKTTKRTFNCDLNIQNPTSNQYAGTTRIIYTKLKNPEYYPYHIFLGNPSEEEIIEYIKVLLIKNLVSSFTQNQFDENTIIQNLIFNCQLYKILKSEDKIILLPTVATIPTAFLFKWLLRYTKKELIKRGREDLAEKIVIPKFLFINSESIYLRENLSNEGIMNQIFQNLKEGLTTKTLDEKLQELKKEIEEKGKNEEEKKKLNFLKYIIEFSLNLKKRLYIVNKELFDDLNIDNLRQKLSELKISFLDDATGMKATYFLSYTSAYLAILDILKDKLKNDWDKIRDEIYDILEREIMPIQFTANLESLDYQTIYNQSANRFIITERLFIELLPIFKRKKEKKSENPEIILEKPDIKTEKILHDFNTKKIEILKEISKYLSPFLADYIITYPNLVIPN
ncbi:MAG: hypothetical protein KatS3mg094_083 [Candidatus Parcubacteria bacterium]|nr:MAG: hypothetical protein KatS3mg094_083 [Candidatus Parcubacteria bacterium]